MYIYFNRLVVGFRNGSTFVDGLKSIVGIVIIEFNEIFRSEFTFELELLGLTSIGVDDFDLQEEIN